MDEWCDHVLEEESNDKGVDVPTIERDHRHERCDELHHHARPFGIRTYKMGGNETTSR